MKKRSLPVYATAALCVLLLIANCYIFFSREWESSFAPASYATLYYPLDNPTIRSWGLAGRDTVRLDLACTTNIAEWTILTDGGKPQTGRGMRPAFHVDTTFSELHTYTLIPIPHNACRPVEISIRFYSTEFYASLGMKHDDVYIVRANAPCGEFDQFTVNDWVDDYAYVGEAGLADARRIVREEIGIRPDDPTFVKMEKLVPFLRKKLGGTGGVPKDDERWMNPWLLYKEIVSGTGKGWCTQNAQLFVFWANQAGIPTRFVFGARTQDNTIVYTGHSFAESFIREQGRWAYVDVTQGQIYITDKHGDVLNTAELFQLNQHDAFDGTTARIYVDKTWEALPGISRTDTVVSVPFPQCNAVVKGEFTPHSIFKYRRPPNVEDVRDIYTGFFKDRTFLVGNLERYFMKPQLAYSLYPTEGAHTYFVRRVLLFGWLASVLLWVGAVMAARRKQ